MHLTIIPSDSAVYRDKAMLVCDLAGVSLPASLHAFQWDGVRGEIEFSPDSDGQKPANLKVQELPLWALECDAQYAQTKMKEIERAVQEAAKLAQQQATLAAQKQATLAAQTPPPSV